MYIKNIFFVIASIGSLYCANALQHMQGGLQTATTHTYTISPNIAAILQDIVSGINTLHATSPLSLIVQDLSNGVVTFDVELISQGLQEAMQLLVAHPRITPETALTYIGIILETLGQLEFIAPSLGTSSLITGTATRR